MENGDNENSIEKEPDNGGLARGFPCVIALERAAKFLAVAHSEMITDNLKESLPPLAYGEQEGDDYPREVLSKFLSEEYGEEIPKSQIFISGGSSLSLYVLGLVVVPKGFKFLVEEVSFFLGVRSIIEDLERETVPVKCSPDGIDLQDFEEKLKIEFASCPEEQTYSCAFYTIPTFHNPRGICYSAETCRAVARLAKQYKALVICDDVYNLLYFEDEPNPRRLRSYALEDDCGKYVVSIGTFSKLCAPGLRLGWMECPPNIFSAIGNLQVLQSGCNFAHYQSYMMAKAIENGSMGDHLRYLRGVYRERATYLLNEITPHLPPGSTLIKPQGGIYVWLELPKEFSATRLREIAMKDYDLDFHVGSRFSLVGGHQNCLRLTFSQRPMKELTIAVGQFLAALKKYTATVGRENCDDEC